MTSDEWKAMLESAANSGTLNEVARLVADLDHRYDELCRSYIATADEAIRSMKEVARLQTIIRSAQAQRKTAPLAKAFVQAKRGRKSLRERSPIAVAELHALMAPLIAEHGSASAAIRKIWEPKPRERKQFAAAVKWVQRMIDSAEK